MKITKVEVFRLPTANSKQNSPIAWPTALVVPAHLAWSAIWQS